MDTKLTKKTFIEAYARSFGNVLVSCKTIGIARQTYYNWLKADPEFAKEIEEIEPQERFLDFLEGKLVEKINNGDTTSIIFALKTKGKKRGYVERQEITGADGIPNNFQVEIIRSDKNKD
jgi:hypothetical protein